MPRSVKRDTADHLALTNKWVAVSTRSKGAMSIWDVASGECHWAAEDRLGAVGASPDGKVIGILGMSWKTKFATLEVCVLHSAAKHLLME